MLISSLIFSNIVLEPGPAVAVICEYDALPGIGHACGHNLIAESGLGAGIAIKAVIEKCGIPGKVNILFLLKIH